MNEALSENQSASVVERGTEALTQHLEEGPDAMAETLSQMECIQSGDDQGGSFDIADMAGRLGADETQMEAAKTEVNFTERVAVLTRKKNDLKEKFERAVQKTLLPVMTAMAMNSAPALAEQPSTDRPATFPETTLVAKAESQELKKEEVFDVHSPLAITGEKMKALKREMLPEELLLVRDFQNKAWQEKNEWMAVSGKDKSGKFLSETKESGALGGTLSFDILENIEGNSAKIHTHPVEAGGTLGLSSWAMRSGETKAFIMAPSAADVGQCMDDAGTDSVGRIVDPVGIWEYRCDENHPFVQARKKTGEEFGAVLEGVKARYQVREEDVVQASAALGTVHPSSVMSALFSELDKKYPGIESDSEAALHEMVRKNQKVALGFLEFETEGNELSRSSVVMPDVDLAKQIQGFIQNAEKKGVYMSYTPFRKPMKTDGGQEVVK